MGVTTISDCYNTGEVNGSEGMTGGVVGWISGSGSVSGCYNIGDVSSGGKNIGGVVGWISNGELVSSCYYNSDNITYTGTLNTYSTGLTTTQMTGITDGNNILDETDRAQDRMSGFSDTDWNFTSDGSIVSEDGSTTTTYYYYPTLKSNTQEPAPSVAVEVNATVPTFTVDLSDGEHTYKETTESLSVTVNIANPDTLSYQWYSATDKTSWSKIGGAISATYTPSSDAIGIIYYKVEVMNTITDEEQTKTATSTSKIATITITKTDAVVPDDSDDEAETTTNVELTGNADSYIDEAVKEQLMNELFVEEKELDVEKKVEVKIDIVSVDDMDEGAQSKFDSYLETYNAGLTDGTSATQALIFDISVIKSLAGVEENITELDKTITITITIPEEYQADGREFFILRNHDGEIQLLEDLDDDPTTITISTDCFSNYTLNYVEVEATTPEGEDEDKGDDGTTPEGEDDDVDEEIATVPDTGDHSMTHMLFIIMCVSLLGVVVVSKKKFVK